MFGKVLIANRGEIACRIARTARRLGVRTVAVYSDADARALHVGMCDEAWRIGPPPARESYLNGAAIIETAKRAGAQAIHPGYGFLSENAAFARTCEQAGIVFVGPSADAIAAMGSKSAAKAIMESAGVPVVPGYHGDDQDDARLAEEAARIGFPVLIKPTAGGGGKGMKVAARADALRATLASARREAKSAFGDARVLLERYLTAPRHIEIQIFADAHGNVVHLFERDCSVQRRHQKVIEEAPAPAPAMDAARRRAMGEAAIAAAKAIGYANAGTVEFIVERDTFYFMEMNTRLQVEHPVTEMVTGCDLVEWQLRVAAGEPLPALQSQLSLRGHAIEARIYAEDPSRDFLPSTGRIGHWRMPEAGARVRVDSGFRAGDEVSAHYDPMLAKLIAWGEDREAARTELLRALSQCEVTGVATNVAFVERTVASDAFRDARIDTGFIDANRESLLPAIAEAPAEALLAASAAEYRAIEQAAKARASTSSDRHSPWTLTDAWWNGTDTHAIAFVFDDGTRERQVCVKPRADGSFDVRGDALRAHVRLTSRGERLAIERLDADGQTTLVATVVADRDVRHVFASGVRARLTRVNRLAHVDAAPERGGHLTAPMSGTIVAVMVKAGDEVRKGAPLVVLEAMKMEHSIVAPAAGRVAAVHFEVGDRVSEGADLVDVDVEERQ